MISGMSAMECKAGHALLHCMSPLLIQSGHWLTSTSDASSVLV